jgi:hypothetical protein
VKEVRWLGLFGVHTMKPPSAMLHCLALWETLGQQRKTFLSGKKASSSKLAY